MKYYEPLRGEILVDGNSIQTLDPNWLRQNVTLVQQQSVLFNETVLQNIEFGRSHPVTRTDILKATKTADLEQTLLDLPEGLHTVIGSNGKSLSGGQQQRVSIARARLRDAPILLLDEANSALDQTSRDKVARTIREWRRGKTTIIITHDVTQILDDEYVYVLENGMVVQEGYRKNLAEKKHGTFASFLPASQTLDQSTLSPQQRRNYEPVSPRGSSDEYLDETVSQQARYISKIFGMQQGSPSTFNQTIGPHSSQLLGLGNGAAQANALRADHIWSTPLTPAEDGLFQPFQSSVSRHSSFKFLLPKVGAHEDFQPSSPRLSRDFQVPDTAQYSTPGNKEVRPRPPELKTQSHKPLTPIVQFELTNQQSQLSPALGRPGNGMQASLKRIFGTIWPTLKWRDRWFLCFGFLSALIVAAGTPAFAYVFAKLLQVYYLRMNREAEALKWALALLGIATIDGVATFCSHYYLEQSGQAWVNILRVEAFKRVLAQPRAWFDEEQNSPGRLNECLDRNAEEMRNLIGRFAGPIFTTFCMLTISIIWSLVIAWKLTLVAVGCAPIMYTVTRLFNWVSSKWEDRCNQASDSTSSIFTETFANIRVVQALTLESHFKKKYSTATAKTYKTGISRATYSGLLFGLTDTLSYFITATIFYYGTVIITSGELPVSSILEVVNLLLFGIANAVSMLNFVPQINTSRTTATHMLYLANLPLRESHENTRQKRLASPFPIVLNNLSLTYSSRPNAQALSSINLTLKAGSCTALVGPSGSGKSTVASILLGLYPPDPAAE